MGDEKMHGQFKRILKYKTLGIIFFLLAPIPLIMFNGLIKYILAAIIFGIGIYFERQYKCPFCGYKFDTQIEI